MRISALVRVSFLLLMIGNSGLLAGNGNSTDPIAIKSSDESRTCDLKTFALLGAGNTDPSPSSDYWKAKWDIVSRHYAANGFLQTPGFRWAASLLHVRLTQSDQNPISEGDWNEAKPVRKTLSLMSRLFPPSLLVERPDIETIKNLTGLSKIEIEAAAQLSRSVAENPELEQELTFAVRSLGRQLYWNLAFGRSLSKELAALRLSDLAYVRVLEGTNSKVTDTLEGNIDLVKWKVTPEDLSNYNSLEKLDGFVRQLVPELTQNWFHSSSLLGWSVGQVFRHIHSAPTLNKLPSEPHKLETMFRPSDRAGSRALALVGLVVNQVPSSEPFTADFKYSLADGKKFFDLLDRNPALYLRYQQVLDGLSLGEQRFRGIYHLAASYENGSRGYPFGQTAKEEVKLLVQASEQQPAVVGPEAKTAALPTEVPANPKKVSPEEIRRVKVDFPDRFPPPLEWPHYRRRFRDTQEMSPTWDHRGETFEFSSEVFSRVQFAFSPDLWREVESGLEDVLHPSNRSEPRDPQSVSLVMQPRLLRTIQRVLSLTEDFKDLYQDGLGLSHLLQTELNQSEKSTHRVAVEASLLGHQNLLHSILPVVEELNHASVVLENFRIGLVSVSASRSRELSPNILRLAGEVQRVVHTLRTLPIPR